VRRARLKAMRRLIFFIASIPLFAGLMAGVAWGASADRLKSALNESIGLLGALEPWQKKLFDEEVLPNYQRFIRDYSSTRVDVDVVNLKNYLNVHAKKSFKREHTNSVVFLHSEAACTKCTEATQGIHKLVKARLERRGFTPAWQTAEELGVTKFRCEQAEEKFLKFAGERTNLSAALMMCWQEIPPDDIDTAHADEKRYIVRSMLLVRDGSDGLVRIAGQLEVIEHDGFGAPAERLLTDAFTDAGGRLASISKTVASGKEEISVEVSGIRDFAHFARVKTRLNEVLQGVASVEERKLSRGQAVFSVLTPRNIEEIRAKLAGFGVGIEGEPPLEMEIR
jgi:hypothetical protein